MLKYTINEEIRQFFQSPSGTYHGRQNSYDRYCAIGSDTLQNPWSSIQSTHTTGYRRNIEASKKE